MKSFVPALPRIVRAPEAPLGGPSGDVPPRPEELQALLARIADLEARYAAVSAEADAATDRIIERDKELIAQRAAFEARLKAAEEERAACQRGLEEWRSYCATLQSSYVNSLSWKISAPVRRIARLLGRGK